MFCSKCGVELRGNGKTCTYCGAARPLIDEWELDWEDAARLREERESAAAPAPARTAVRHEADSCVRPGDARKICADCGKELPSSAISDVCAMCSIRRNDREAELARQRAAARPLSQGDRFYRPDQFASRNNTSVRDASYYNPDEESSSAWHSELLREERKDARKDDTVLARNARKFRFPTSTTAKKPVNPVKIIVGIVAVFFVATNAFAALGNIFFGFVSEKKAETRASYAQAALSDEEQALYTKFLEPCLNQLFSSMELTRNGSDVSVHSDTPNFVEIIPDSADLEIAGYNNFIRGYATFSRNDRLYDLPFRVCLVFVDDSGAYSTYLELMENVHWDYIDTPLSELTGESPVTLYELAARSNAAGVLPAAVSQTVSGVTVSVEPMMEMLAVVQYLSNYNEQFGLLTQHETSYQADIEAAFRAYEEHPAVSFFNEAMTEGFAFDIPPTACLYLDENFQIRPEFDGSDYERNRLTTDLASFRDVMEQFYYDTDFGAFYESHRDFYTSMTNAYAANFPDWNMTQAMEDYYGKKMAGYHIILVPLFHPGGFGPTLELADGAHVYSVQGPYQAKDDTPLFGDSDAIANLVIHEFGHSFVPVNDRDNPVMVAEVLRSQFLMDAVHDDMARNAYSDWTSAYEELVLRAAVIDIMKKNTQVDPETLLQYEREVGFIYIDTAYQAILSYSPSRDQYPVFDDFIPVITDALRAEYPIA